MDGSNSPAYSSFTGHYSDVNTLTSRIGHLHNDGSVHSSPAPVPIPANNTVSNSDPYSQIRSNRSMIPSGFTTGSIDLATTPSVMSRYPQGTGFGSIPSQPSLPSLPRPHPANMPNSAALMASDMPPRSRGLSDSYSHLGPISGPPNTFYPFSMENHPSSSIGSYGFGSGNNVMAQRISMIERPRPASALEIDSHLNRPSHTLPMVTSSFNTATLSRHFPNTILGGSAALSSTLISKPTPYRPKNRDFLDDFSLSSSSQNAQFGSSMNGAVDYFLGSTTDVSRGTTQYTNSSANLMSVASTQREMNRLQQELDVTRDKLQSCMNSIKTFWSPELKKERAIRKEESVKYNLLAEHFHSLQMEKQSMLTTIHNLEGELRRESELRNRSIHTAQGMELLQQRCEELHKENLILVQQQEEMEAFSVGQKQALLHQEEGIRRLVEMLKGKLGPGRGVERIEEDRLEIDRLRNELQEVNKKVLNLKRALVEKDSIIGRIKEELNLKMEDLTALKRENDSHRQETKQFQMMQSIIDTKDSKILALEGEIRLLENEVARFREFGSADMEANLLRVLGATPPLDDAVAIEKSNVSAILKNNEKTFRIKLELLNSELSKRDAEVYALRSKVEMAERQLHDHLQHIDILKEQVKARDHKITMLMSDMEEVSKRQKEKEMNLEKKNRSLGEVQNEKRQLEKELNELREQMDIREKKIVVQQKKIESLEDLLNDKEAQLASAKARLVSWHLEQNSEEGCRMNLEEAVREKERQLERLKESKTRAEREYTEELESLKKGMTELRNRYENSQRELDEKKMQLLQLREEITQLRADKFKRESDLTQVQNQLTQKVSDLSQLQMEMQLLKKQQNTEIEFKTNQHIRELETQVNHYMEQAVKTQGEVERLMHHLRVIETEKTEKEKTIREQEESINSLKRSQQMERKKHMQALEDIRLREESSTVDIEILKSTSQEKDARIRELEQSLKESIKASTEREAFLAGREQLHRQQENQMSELKHTMDNLQREKNLLDSRLTTMQQQLHEKESQIRSLEKSKVASNTAFTVSDFEPQTQQDYSLKICALLKLLQSKDAQLSEKERSVLQSLNIFFDYVSNTWQIATGRGASPLTGHITVGVAGGSTLPTSTNSAFQAFNSNPQSENARLTRILSEKEVLVTQLREEVNLLNRKIQDLQREKNELKGYSSSLIGHGGLSYLETLRSRASPGAALLFGGMSGPSETELRLLQSQNEELQARVNALQRHLDEKEDRLRQMHLLYSRGTTPTGRTMADSSLMEYSSGERDVQIRVFKQEIERLKEEKNEINNMLLEGARDVREKTEKVQLLEGERIALKAELESIQKKYQNAMSQISDKSERLHTMENECLHKHVMEIKMLKDENEDMKHRQNYIQKTSQDRETKIEQLEKDLYKQREEVTTLKSEALHLDLEVQRLKEEVAFRDERNKQLSQSHASEGSRMRGEMQEHINKLVDLRKELDDRDNVIRTLVAEKEKMKMEIDHSRRQFRDMEEDHERWKKEMMEKEERVRKMEREHFDERERCLKATENLNLLQRRMEEREARLRKVEQENHALLEEVHQLRKRVYDLEINLDSVKLQVIDKSDGLTSRSSSSVDVGYSSQIYSNTSSSANSLEMERLRKEYSRVSDDVARLNKLLMDAQTRMDQLSMERNSLTTQLQQESLRVKRLQNMLDKQENDMPSLLRQTDVNRRDGEEITRLTIQNQQLMDRITTLQNSMVAQPFDVNKDKYGEFQIRHELEAKDREIQRLNQLVNSVRKQFQSCEEERDRTVNELNQRLNQFVETQQMQRMQDSQSQLHLSHQQLQSHYRQMQQSYQECQKKLESAQAESRQNQQQLEKLNQDLMESVNRTQQLARQLKETQDRCDDMSSERDSLRDQLSQMSSNNRESQMVHLSREMERLHSEKEQLQRELDEARVKATLSSRERDSALSRHHRIPQTWDADPDWSTDLLKEEVEAKDRKIEQLNQQLQRASKEIMEQQQLVKNMESEMQQLRSEISLQQNRRLSSQGEERQHLFASRSSSITTDQSTYQRVLEELQQTKEALQERQEAYQKLSDEVNHLRQEIQQRDKQNSNSYSQQQQQQQQNSLSNDSNHQQLKMEVDSLKRELSQRTSEVQRLERECKMNHIQKLESLQMKLSDMEQETNRLRAKLDELIEVIADKESAISQLKTQIQQKPVGNVVDPRIVEELEHLQKEHSRCDSRITKLVKEVEQKTEQISAMEKQLERQIEEVLEVRQEALTASVCEKDANIALMEISGVRNAQANQALNNLKKERNDLQAQLNQLRQARAKMKQEKTR